MAKEKRREEKKKKDLKDETGINSERWVDTMPDDVKEDMSLIIETLGREDAFEKYTSVVESLHNIVPEYPLLHWRHLHDNLRERIKSYYQNEQYGVAASQGVQIFCEIIRKLTGRTEDGRDLVNRIFGSSPFNTLPEIQLNDLGTESLKNIQEGQGHLSRGIVMGFRNPISHGPIDANVPALFTELDCLNILSIVSYLITRMDNATVNVSSNG